MNRIAIWAGIALASCATAATAVTFSGRLDDPANAALVASNMGPAQFATLGDVANNLALYDLLVAVGGPVTVQSTGFGTGGVDPYFTLFSGTGGTATFLDSNFTQTFATGGDFNYVATLAAGSYTLALGAFANQSFAENLGNGTLADGFTALGTPGVLGDTGYRLVVTTQVPELPATALLVLGLLALRWRVGRAIGVDGPTAAF